MLGLQGTKYKVQGQRSKTGVVSEFENLLCGSLRISDVMKQAGASFVYPRVV
jgi:hypothetical protein